MPAQERWQRLTAQAVAGTELDLDGIVIKTKGGVRLAYGSEADTVIDRDTSIIDVAFALARAGKGVANAAEVLDASGRPKDEFLWSTISELGGQLAESDTDGEVFTWLTRNRREVSNAAANVQAARAAEQRREAEAGDQLSFF